MKNKTLRTSGDLTLIASTLTHIIAELEAPEQLADLLNATVSPQWPTGEYDRDAMEFFRACFEKGGEAVEGWYGWYAVRDQDATAPRSLVGAAGYFGPPDASGVVEIGYSVLPEWQRRGYARQMVQALIENAFTLPEVHRIIAHTTEQNAASVAVLRRCGFQSAGPGDEPGLIRFERARTSA